MTGPKLLPLMFSIPNMEDKHVEGAKRKMLEIDGIAEASGEAGQLSVKYDPAKLTITEILRALQKLGLRAGMM